MMTLKDIEEICEKHDFNTNYDENAWQDKAGLTISQYTPAGEDWSEILEASSVGDFVGDLEKRVENWDIDEEVEPYIDMRGRNGIPSSIRELLEDAEWKLNTLKELLADIKTAMANDMDVMRGKDESKELKTEEKTIVPVSELPDMCYGVLPSDCSIIIIKKGEKGYYTTNKNYESAYADIKDYEERCKKADELCNKLNSQIDVTPEQRQSMEIRSMFGNWEDKKEESNTFAIAEDMYNNSHEDKWHQLSDDEKADYYNQNYKEILKYANIVDKKEEAVTPNKEYMGIKYFDNKDGKCPVCNEDLDYDAVEHAGDNMEFYRWKCKNCGTCGAAWYKAVFQGHLIRQPGRSEIIDLPLSEEQ